MNNAEERSLMLKESLQFLDGIGQEEIGYFNKLYCAIEGIRLKDIQCHTPFSNDQDEEAVERSINGKLYHLFQNMIENDNKLHLMSEIEMKKKITTHINNAKPNFFVYPDLILHKSQDSLDCKSQLFVCEIKRISQLGIKNFLVDINKLLIFTSDKLWDNNGYKSGIFIVLGSNLDQFMKKISLFNENNNDIELKDIEGNINKVKFRSYIDTNTEQLKRIICFLHDGQIVKVYNLYKLISLLRNH